MLSGHMLLSSLKMYFSHSAIALLPSSQCLTPPLINTSARFLFAPSSHFICFWSTHCIFQGGSCAQAVKIHPHKCSKATPLLFCCHARGGFLHKLCLTPFLFLVGLTQYTHRCSCSSWLSIPMTTGVRAIATGRWREDRVKAAQKYTLFCVSKYSKYTPLVQHWIEETKNRERMEPKRGIICEMRAGNPSPNVLISQKCLTPGGTLSLQVILIALCAWRRSLSNEFLSISYYLDISTHT